MRIIENCREDRKNQVHWHYIDNLTVTAVQYHYSNISFLVTSLFSIIIIIIITIIIIVKNLHGHRHKYHQQLQLKNDKIVIIRQASSLYYFCLYRCWINGSQWIYQGPVLVILLVSTNDFTWYTRSPYPSLRVKFVL